MAEIVGVHGVRGAVKLNSFATQPADLIALSPLQNAAGHFFTITQVMAPARSVVAFVSGVTTRDAAMALRGERLYAPRDKLPPLPKGQFYRADLIGLLAVSTTGDILGKLTAFDDYGAGLIMNISGKAEMLLPYNNNIVTAVDLAAGRIIINLPVFVDERDESPA